MTLHEFEDLFDYHYSNKDLGAAVASGSFLTDGMVIVPASMKTIAGISIGLGENLIARAADVTLKEQRKLVLVPSNAVECDSPRKSNKISTSWRANHSTNPCFL